MNFQQNNISYWTKRAKGYSCVNQAELSGTQHTVWQKTLQAEISAHFKGKQPAEISVLDVGTGPGFFAILLAELGYGVTAIDYTSSMLKEARANAGALAISFFKMDAQALAFTENKFDVVLSRNLTWNLQQPQAAYQEWHRVLKPNGLLLNFDANWYRYLHDACAQEGHRQDRENIYATQVADETAGTDVIMMEHLAFLAPLSGELRPAWDLDFLLGLGMHACADLDIWQTVWTFEERINNASTPMFLIRAHKKG